jgi:hypothetical protein
MAHTKAVVSWRHKGEDNMLYPMYHFESQVTQVIRGEYRGGQGPFVRYVIANEPFNVLEEKLWLESITQDHWRAFHCGYKGGNDNLRNLVCVEPDQTHYVVGDHLSVTDKILIRSRESHECVQRHECVVHDIVKGVDDDMGAWTRYNLFKGGFHFDWIQYNDERDSWGHFEHPMKLILIHTEITG